MVVDVGRLFGLHDEWRVTLPGICPFYAVKCNDDLLLLKTMAAMGLGFDCASKVRVWCLHFQSDENVYPCLG